jgi:hypothetical protein
MAVHCPASPTGPKTARAMETRNTTVRPRPYRHDAMHITIHAAMVRMIRAYRDADKALRDGRPSWDADCLSQLPPAFSDEGDKR